MWPKPVAATSVGIEYKLEFVRLVADKKVVVDKDFHINSGSHTKG